VAGLKLIKKVNRQDAKAAKFFEPPRRQERQAIWMKNLY